MWRGKALLVVGLLAGAAAAAVFSEGGQAVGKLSDSAYYGDADSDRREAEDYMQDILELEQRREEEKQLADQLLRQQQLEKIMEQLGSDYEAVQGELAQAKPVAPRDARDEATLREIERAIEEEKKKGEKEQGRGAEALQQRVPAKGEEQLVEQPKQEETVDESAEAQPTHAAPSAQKKGQGEFVSFIDPEASRLTKNVPSMEKRRLNEVRVQRLKGDGGLLYLAVGTVMLVGVVGGVVGGALLYRRRREEPDDQEYAPYAGTGPRSKKAIKGEQGDDTLAYKAQLHHYQQAKQKIICGEDNAGVAGESEDEGEDVDDENNFSVYECPGLAPTGDIEVHNPNFSEPSPRQ